MPPPQYTEEEEAAFMKDLLTGLDDSFFNAVPSPDPTPIKLSKSHQNSRAKPPVTPSRPIRTPKKQKTPIRSKLFTAQDVDMAALMEGVEDWDWDDMDSDFLSPKKNKPVPEVRDNPHPRQL